MKLKNQVCSLELSKKLKELGVKQESLWIWMWVARGAGLNTYHELTLTKKRPKGFDETEDYSAFTVAELGDMLPCKIRSIRCKGNGLWLVSREIDDEILGEKAYHAVQANTEANARAKMLVYLIENKLMEAKK
jgi:hypothetical protein